MGRLITEYVQGALVLREEGEARILDAFGPAVTKFVEDFVAAPVDAVSGEYDPQWTITRVEAGAGESSFAPQDGLGGIGRITTDANENDGINAQVRGRAFKLVADAIAYFGARIKVSEATQSDFFVGLAVTSTNILGGVTDRIGFQKVDGEAGIKAMLEKDSTETLSAALATLTTGWHVVEFYVHADGSVRFLIDGVVVWEPALTNFPDDEELSPALQFLAGSAGAKTLDVDWMRAVQIGGR
ncbi:MAG: hypothetical protein KJ067_23200 [Vicinamibacteria bacterium]|nr:hypothetical protein [Vicinamibacteria bacterium]